MKKIIFLASQPLEQRNFYRFGLDLFIKENWKIIYCYFKNICLRHFLDGSIKQFKLIYDWLEYCNRAQVL